MATLAQTGCWRLEARHGVRIATPRARAVHFQRRIKQLLDQAFTGFFRAELLQESCSNFSGPTNDRGRRPCDSEKAFSRTCASLKWEHRRYSLCAGAAGQDGARP